MSLMPYIAANQSAAAEFCKNQGIAAPIVHSWAEALAELSKHRTRVERNFKSLPPALKNDLLNAAALDSTDLRDSTASGANLSDYTANGRKKIGLAARRMRQTLNHLGNNLTLREFTQAPEETE